MSPSRKNDVPVPEKRCPRRDGDINHPVVWVDQDVNDPEQKMIDDKCG